MDHHELTRPVAPVKVSSDRSFGLVFTVCLAILAVHNWWRAAHVWPLYGTLALAFLALAILWPHALKPLNALWSKLGTLLGAIVSPVVMALLFFSIVTPTGLLMRLAGKDTLRLRRIPEGRSYWIVREPPGPPGECMRDQF
jgi:Saxitoxin biosynthesis operon protein SxtJ